MFAHLMKKTTSVDLVTYACFRVKGEQENAPQK